MDIWLYILSGIGVALATTFDDEPWLSFLLTMALWPTVFFYKLTKKC